MSRIDEIRARCEAATRGPWEQTGGFGQLFMCDTGDGRDVSAIIGEVYRRTPFKQIDGTAQANMDFIIHAREDIPYLLDENERLARENAALRHENAGYLCDELHCGTCVNVDVNVCEEPCATCVDGCGLPAWEFDEAKFT